MLSSAELKHTLKGVFKKAKFESTQSVALAVLTQELSPVISNKIIDIVKRSSQIIIIIILKGKQRQRFDDMGLIELRKTNNFQPQSHF